MYGSAARMYLCTDQQTHPAQISMVTMAARYGSWKTNAQDQLAHAAYYAKALYYSVGVQYGTFALPNVL